MKRNRAESERAHPAPSGEAAPKSAEFSARSTMLPLFVAPLLPPSLKLRRTSRRAKKSRAALPSALRLRPRSKANGCMLRGRLEERELEGAAHARPSWDEYFSRIAVEVSTRSTCLRRHVGAILVLDKRILATGYNGAPRGLRHCLERGCIRQERGIPSGQRHDLCRGLHAEMNVLIQAASHGIRVEGATLYSTSFPCSLCAKMMINGGIRRIVAQSDYPDTLSKELLAEADVKTELFDARQHPARRSPSSRATGPDARRRARKK